MAAYGGHAAEDQFKAERAQEFIKRFFRRGLLGLGRATEAGQVSVDERVANCETLLLLYAVNGAVGEPLQPSFCVHRVSKLLHELPSFVLLGAGLIVRVELLSFDAFDQFFNLVQPLRRAEAAVCHDAVEFVLQQGYLCQLVVLMRL